MSIASAQPIRSRLPSPRTPIIGRDVEIASVRALIARPDVPLVTLIGPGGIGKTRLAIELARLEAESFPDGAIFVGLSDIDDPVLVGPAIAQALGIVPVPGQESEETLLLYLTERRLLLVLDNFEQIVASASSIARLLEAAPDVKLLITSRSPLRIHGEHEFPVKPLALAPDDEAARNGAMALFIERAAAVDPRFSLTAANSEQIRKICMRLDGLPLAIELAAARMRLLTPELLLDRLEHGLAILSSGARDAPERQKTMTNAIAWSYGLLAPGEQWLFRQLSVFAGGFDLRSVSAVAGQVLELLPPEGMAQVDPLEGISALIDQSLLRRIELVEGEPRLTMLHTIREFAREALEKSEETRSARLAHATYFAEQLARAHTTLKGPNQIEWMAWTARELDNLRASATCLLDYGEKERALSLIFAASSFWEGRIALREFDAWLDRAFALPGSVSTRVEFGGVFTRAWSRTFQGDQIGAKSFAERALELALQLGSTNDLLKAYNLLGGIAVHEADYETAWKQFSEALTLSENWKDAQHVQSLLHNLGVVAMARGDMIQARAMSERALERAQSRGDRIGEALCLVRLGQLAVDRGDIGIGAEMNRRALGVIWEARHAMGASEAIATESVIADFAGDRQRADRLMEFSLSISGSLGLQDISFEASTPYIDRFKLIEQRLLTGRTGKFVMPDSTQIAEVVREILGYDRPGVEASCSPVGGTSEQSDNGLTTREREIVRLLARGSTNQEIADDLFISLRTAQTHVSNILNKLQLTSRAAVAAYAVRNGIE